MHGPFSLACGRNRLRLSAHAAQLFPALGAGCDGEREKSKHPQRPRRQGLGQQLHFLSAAGGCGAVLALRHAAALEDRADRVRGRQCIWCGERRRAQLCVVCQAAALSSSALAKKQHWENHALKENSSPIASASLTRRRTSTIGTRYGVKAASASGKSVGLVAHPPITRAPSNVRACSFWRSGEAVCGISSKRKKKRSRSYSSQIVCRYGQPPQATSLSAASAESKARAGECD